jgi:RsiW-degrading membrane proteinase PrsW (M82 family)
MGFAILAAGALLGVAVDAAVPAWITEDTLAGDEDPEDPTPEPLDPDSDLLKGLADRGEWRELFWAVPWWMARTWQHGGSVALAVLTGACWLAFAWQSIQPRGARDARAWLPFVAMALGVLSIWPTMFLIFWQERVWGLEESELLAPAIRFFVLGVGLREELSKFVCFLPLLPWVVWRRDELAALVLAGCVGIGFGMEENVGYIYGSIGTGTLGRLMMPVPLHMAMTGLIGLAAYRACVWPKEWGPQFIAWFGVVVLAHGIYDVLAGTPAVAEYGILGFLIFIGLVRQYFHELRPKQSLRVEPVSLTANFLFCVSTVAAATFVYLSAAIGWQTAADVMVMGIAAEAVMVYLFLREMPETMVSV